MTMFLYKAFKVHKSDSMPFGLNKVSLLINCEVETVLRLYN